MNKLKIYFPFLNWIQEIRNPVVLRADLIAGVTVALVLIPQSMAYAQLAGLPPYYGLYAAFIPVVIGALWGSSRQLQTGPVAVVSLMTAAAIAPLAATGSPEFVGLAIMLAFMVGVVQFSIGFFRLGAIVNFLSHPVVVGFTNAAALIIGLSQLNKIFGVERPTEGIFLQQVYGVLMQLGDTHLTTLLMGVVAFAIMFGFKKYYPKIPGVLIAVVGTTVASWMLGFTGSVVGKIPEGLPSIKIPAFDIEIMSQLVVSALFISFVGFMEAISIAKAMAAKTKHRIDPNQELIGQGLANMLGSFAQSYPVSGSFSRSAVNLDAGAKSGMSSVFTALIVLITLLFLTPLLYHLPEAVLAAVIMMAVFGLINFKAIKKAWRAHKHDGIAAVVTFVATLGFAPHLENGIMIGAGLAIGLYLYRTMHPRVATLGRFEDGTLRDIKVYPELPTDERIVAVRFDGSLYFANISYFEDEILAAAADSPKAKYILIVGDGINGLDASGQEMLHNLIERLKESNVTMVFSGLKRQVLRVMRRTGLFDVIGRQNIYATEDMALLAIYNWLDIHADAEFCPLKPKFAT